MLNGVTGIESKVVAAVVAQPQLESRSGQASSQRSEKLDFSPPFISPAVRLDPVAKQVVLEFRDSESGEVLKQIPSEKQMSAYSSKETVESATTQSVSVDINFESTASTSRPSIENNVQPTQNLSPSGTLGDGDTSSFTV